MRADAASDQRLTERRMVTEQSPVESAAGAARTTIENKPIRRVEEVGHRWPNRDRLPNLTIARQAPGQRPDIIGILAAVQLNGRQAEHDRSFGDIHNGSIAEYPHGRRVKRSKPQRL